MELFRIKSNIDEIANALTYQISLVSTVFSGHIVKNYKLEEITNHFVDRIKEYDLDYINENWDDLHNEIFNTDYYIIGRHQATKWLGEEVFNVMEYIKQCGFECWFSR